MTPSSPTAPAGSGSVIIASTTATNRAKKCQAPAVSPAGTGSSASSSPAPIGSAARR